MRTRPAHLFTATMALALVLCACSAAPSPTPALSSPTNEPTPSPAGSGSVTDLLRVGDGPLTAGTYTRSDFSPALTFTVGEGWQPVQAVSGFFDVQQNSGTLDVIAVQFCRPTSWPTAGAAVAGVATLPNLALSDSHEVTVGGLPGHQLTVSAINGDLQAQQFVRVLSVPAGPISIASGRRLQITFVDTSDGLLAILVGGSVRHWDATLAVAAPVVASVSFR